MNEHNATIRYLLLNDNLTRDKRLSKVPRPTCLPLEKFVVDSSAGTLACIHIYVGRDHMKRGSRWPRDQAGGDDVPTRCDFNCGTGSTRHLCPSTPPSPAHRPLIHRHSRRKSCRSPAISVRWCSLALRDRPAHSGPPQRALLRRSTPLRLPSFSRLAAAPHLPSFSYCPADLLDLSSSSKTRSGHTVEPSLSQSLTKS